MNDGAITISPLLPRAFPFYVLTPCTKSCTLNCINRFLKHGIFCDLFDVHFGVWHVHTLCETISAVERENISVIPQFPPAPLKSIPPGPSPAPASFRQPSVCFLSLLISLHSLEFYVYSCFVSFFH